MMKRAIHQENLTSLNLYATNIRAKTEFKGKTDKTTITVGNFNVPHPKWKLSICVWANISQKIYISQSTKEEVLSFLGYMGKAKRPQWDIKLYSPNWKNLRTWQYQVLERTQIHRIVSIMQVKYKQVRYHLRKQQGST